MGNLYTKNRGTSTKHPTPPPAGRSNFDRDGIVTTPRPNQHGEWGARDIANYGVLGGAVTHKLPQAAQVGIAGTVGAMDAYDANRSQTALKEQLAHTDALHKQKHSDWHLRSGAPETVAKWDATYDDPRR